jgi:cytochrome b
MRLPPTKPEPMQFASCFYAKWPHRCAVIFLELMMTTTPNQTESTSPAAPLGSATTTVNPSIQRVALWDLPMRIFHWFLVIAIAVAIASAQVGGEWMEIHEQAGIVTIGLIAFRLVWGMIGSTYARFSHFFPTPTRVKDYLGGRWAGLGHNPIGAFSVFALLGILATQAVTGLFANDDITFEGPWSGRISKELSDSITGFHHDLSEVIYILLGLHVAAILFYRLVKKNDLVKPMITGWKNVDAASVPASEPAKKGGWVALIAAIVVAFAAMSLAWSGKSAPVAAPAPAATTSFESPTAPVTPEAASGAASASKPAVSGW